MHYRFANRIARDRVFDARGLGRGPRIHDNASQAQKPAGDLRDRPLCAPVQSRAERIQRPLRHDLYAISWLEGSARVRNAKVEACFSDRRLTPQRTRLQLCG